MAGWLLLGGVEAARAHQSGDGYLLLGLTNGTLSGQIDLGLRELDTALGLDDDGNGVISRTELKDHRGELLAYVRTNVTLRLDGTPLEIVPHDLRVEERLGVPFLVWRFRSPLPRLPQVLEAEYRCLFEVDALHRAFAKVEWEGRVATGMFSPAVTRQHWDIALGGRASSTAQSGLRTFIRDGVWHIWTGYDHMLFLLALLLPAVVERSGRRWVGVTRLKPALWRVLQTVTA
ncbi:MAG TPA: HupE/UreJ family protein, partial [Myxococcota bacterium]|nr:HupE/UreJ family protein [Myxococcota bacterium]